LSFDSLRPGKCCKKEDDLDAVDNFPGFNSLRPGKCFASWSEPLIGNDYHSEFRFPTNGKVLCKPVVQRLEHRSHKFRFPSFDSLRTGRRIPSLLAYLPDIDQTSRTVSIPYEREGAFQASTGMSVSATACCFDSLRAGRCLASQVTLLRLHAGFVFQFPTTGISREQRR
jgi:hypothetical protein